MGIGKWSKYKFTKYINSYLMLTFITSAHCSIKSSWGEKINQSINENMHSSYKNTCHWNTHTNCKRVAAAIRDTASPASIWISSWYSDPNTLCKAAK